MPWIEAIHREQPSLGRIEANSENQLGIETSIEHAFRERKEGKPSTFPS